MAYMLTVQYCSVFSPPKQLLLNAEYIPDSKDHGGNMGPTWVLSAPGGPYVGPMNLAIRDIFLEQEGNSQLSAAQLSNTDFNEVDIIRKILFTPAAGPDRFPVMLLKQWRTALSKPLYLMWTDPHLLKAARIIPIHKGSTGGNPQQLQSHCPDLTSHKDFWESPAKGHGVIWRDMDGHLNPSLHGFVLGIHALVS